MAANSSLSGSSGSWGLEPPEGTTEANNLSSRIDHGVQEILLNEQALVTPGRRSELTTQQVSSTRGKDPLPKAGRNQHGRPEPTEGTGSGHFYFRPECGR